MQKLSQKHTVLSMVLATSLGLGFNGCSSSDTTTATGTASGSKDVTVERGKVYDATVTDSSSPAQTAKQLDGKNVYRFTNTPTYPVTANGGWIDVNDNDEMDKEDVKLNIKLRSYSNRITTISTYAADANKSVRQERLEALKDRLNDTAVGDNKTLGLTDLQALPSQASRDVLIAMNAIYQEMVQNPNQSVELNTVLSLFSSIDSSIGDSVQRDDLASFIEKYIVAKLGSAVTHVTDAEIELYKQRNNLDDGNGDGQSTLTPEMANDIVILKNLTEPRSKIWLDSEGRHPTLIDASINCSSYGDFSLFNTLETTQYINKLYFDGDRKCVEFDYSIEGQGGDINVLNYYNR